MTGSQQVNTRFPDGLLAEVEEWAKREQRDRSQMIRILVGEALAERKRIDDEGARPMTVQDSLIADEDVRDVAEWLHPVWFSSENGASQTYSDLERAVRGALESRADAMRDRWVAEIEDRREAVTFLVAEQRDGLWLFGDDWAASCDTLVEAQQVAERWRAHDRSDPVGVFAVCEVQA